MTDNPRLSLRLHFDSGLTFGRGKADLLQGIDEEGSIAAAGRRMGMSYKRAWGLAEVLNGMFREPLIASSRGGSQHGGASLTPLGREVLGHYRALQAHCLAAGAVDIAALARLAAPPDVADGI